MQAATKELGMVPTILNHDDDNNNGFLNDNFALVIPVPVT